MEDFQDRIWLPYQVGLEYHFNRLTVIQEQKDSYNKIVNKLIDKSKDTKEKLSIELKSYRKRHASLDINEILESIEKSFMDIVSKVKEEEEKHHDFTDEDVILDTLTELFKGKVGDPTTQEKINQINQSGIKRYKGEIPPGYKDLNEKKGKMKFNNNTFINSEYGDLIVWEQMIEKANVHNKPIIFITDDEKEDWWQIVGGRITVGPRPELRNEFKVRTNNNFYMYKTYSFMERAKRFLGKEVNNDAVNEVKDMDEFEQHPYKLELPFILDEDIDIYSRMIEKTYSMSSIAANNVYNQANKWLENMNNQRKLEQRVVSLERNIQEVLYTLPTNRSVLYRKMLIAATQYSHNPDEILSRLEELYEQVSNEAADY